MLSIFERLATGFMALCQRVAQLVLPFLSQARNLRGKGSTLRWILHGLVIAGIVFGLFFLNQYLRLGEKLLGPLPLRRFWLPILFLLVYVLGWLGWWLWKLLVPDVEESLFPDIDAA